MARKVLLVARNKAEHQGTLTVHPVDLVPHEILHSPNPTQALETLREHSDIDVLIIDWNMRSVISGGLDLCRQARDSQRPHHLYIILVADQEYRTKTHTALKYGTDAFLFKPIEVGEWVSHVQIAHQIRVLEKNLAEHLARLNAVRQQLDEVEREKKQFYRDVLRAVTKDKLHFVEAREIPDIGTRTFSASLSDARDLARLRHDLRQRALAIGMDPEQTHHLVAACGEALTNGLRHGTEPRWEVWENGRSLTGRIVDNGRGISPDVLPASVLRPGFSTQTSMGVGFEVMLQCADRMWLATGASGTTVQLSNWIHPEAAAPPLPFPPDLPGIE